MKVAILLLSLDNAYYRSIFDTIENKSVADRFDVEDLAVFLSSATSIC